MMEAEAKNSPFSFNNGCHSFDVHHATKQEYFKC